MCNCKINSDTNPAFVLYNLVFGSSRGEVITASVLSRQMADYGRHLDVSVVEDNLHQWYCDGRLNERNGGYVLA